jgi:hypothetical protein
MNAPVTSDSLSKESGVPQVEGIQESTDSLIFDGKPV